MSEKLYQIFSYDVPSGDKFDLKTDKRIKNYCFLEGCYKCENSPIVFVFRYF